MGFKNRINILLKSQFNHWMTQAEDPEKIMNQAVEEMEEGLDMAKRRLAALKSRLGERERFLQRISKQISYWQERAEGFLKDDMEENAKEAVRRRRILEEEERKLKIDQTGDRVRLKEMETVLQDLEARVQMAKAKRNILVRNIRLREGITEEIKEAEGLSKIDFEEPFSLLRKMEERVEEETGFAYLKQAKEEEARENEEKLINEEIERLKKRLKEEVKNEDKE